jgi:hypothetical protein
MELGASQSPQLASLERSISRLAVIASRNEAAQLAQAWLGGRVGWTSANQNGRWWVADIVFPI